MYQKPISLIIPCYQATDFLSECWESVKEQSIGLEKIQCIFVDDASPDDTYDRLLTIKKEAPESVEIIRHEKNLRQGGARNTGLAHAKGKYTQFLDQDDRLQPTACEELYLLAEEYQTDLIQFDYYHPDGKDPQDLFCSEDGFYTIESVSDRKTLLMSGLFYCTHHNLFYRSDLLREVGSRFPEHRVYEEPLFVYPLYFYAKRLMILSKGLYLGRAHKDSSTNKLLPSRLMDHPIVQFQLHDFLLEKGLASAYSDEINFYILWSAFGETVINASRNPADFSLQDFLWLQAECRKRFPAWKSNPYPDAFSAEIRQILSMIDKDCSSPEELDLLLAEVKRLSTAI